MSEIKSVGGVRDMKDWTKNAWNKVAIPLVLAGLNWAGTERIDRDKKKGVSQFAITGMIFGKQTYFLCLVVLKKIWLLTCFIINF